MRIKMIAPKKGFTLVEIIVSVTLLVFVFSAFITVFQTGISLRTNSQRRLQALATAQTCIEEVRGGRYPHWKNQAEFEYWLEHSLSYAKVGNNYTKDSIIITLERINPGIPYPGVPNPPMLISVRVEVAYPVKMSSGGTKSIVLETRLREVM